MLSAVNVLANRRKISDLTNREVYQLNLSQIDEKKIKVLLCIFQECFRPVNTLTAKKCSETGPSSHLSKNIFRSQ